jgi:Icc protein
MSMTTKTKTTMTNRFSRREWLAQVGVAAGATMLGNVPQLAGAADLAAATGQQPKQRKRALRVAHLTDVHVQPERGASEGLAACLRHVQSQADKVDVIFTGGDHIMDSTNQDRARTQLQWDVWRNVIKADCSLPIYSAIGNHDIWGWNKKRSGTTGEEAQWGKKWGTDALGLDRSYHSFDRAGWHFAFLDSMLPEIDETTKAAYTAGLDDAQFDWLKQDLAATAPTTPVMIVSHIPIYSVAALNGNAKDETGAVRFPKGGVHADYKRLKDLFRRHRNVKLAVSGHLHHTERIDYAGVTYLCNGAVCGGWWKGSHMDECDAGYAVLDLYDDGSFDHKYVNYGWAYHPEPAAIRAG